MGKEFILKKSVFFAFLSEKKCNFAAILSDKKCSDVVILSDKKCRSDKKCSKQPI